MNVKIVEKLLLSFYSNKYTKGAILIGISDIFIKFIFVT